MTNFQLRRLCRPETLRAIDSRRLDQLLRPHATYLAERGIVLPITGRDEPLKLWALIRLLVAPDRAMPGGLIDALYFIDELATPSGLEALRAQAKAAGLHLREHAEPAPADIALQVWLFDRRILERVHAEQAVRRLRAFRYFRPTAPARTIHDLDARLAAMTEALNEGFGRRGRGRYARIITDRQDGSLWLYIAHGGVMRREGTVEDARPGTICYRPEVYDALVLDTTSGALGIHARSEWERALYQRLMGKHLFDHEGMFITNPRYSLQPLWEHGREALYCQDVSPAQWAKLVQLTVRRAGRVPRTEVFRADDLFASWGRDRLPFGGDVTLLAAGFRVQLIGLKTPRLVVLRPVNQAQYTRDVDRVWIEDWLGRRGFIQPPTPDDRDADDPSVLAVA